jgi:lysozyme family protein
MTYLFRTDGLTALHNLKTEPALRSPSLDFAEALSSEQNKSTPCITTSEMTNYQAAEGEAEPKEKSSGQKDSPLLLRKKIPLEMAALTSNRWEHADVQRRPIPKPEKCEHSTQSLHANQGSFAAGNRTEKTGAGLEFDEAFAFIIRKNGDLVKGNNPMKFGIMQSTLKDYDPSGRIAKRVDGLDEAKAKQIYQMIWKRAGCNELSYPLNVIHFDAYVQRPATAMQALKNSGGDPELYLRIRNASLSELKKYKEWEPRWKTRIAELRTHVKLESAATDEEKQPLKLADSSTMSSRAASNYRRQGSMDFEEAFAFVLQHEGAGYVANDNGRGPSKFGILQTTLKHYDPKGAVAQHVRQLDQRGARLIYRKIWLAAGCDKLKYPLNVLHFDATVHRPKTAMESLKFCGGDPALYQQSRLASLQELKSFARYGSVWEKRINRLSELKGKD